MLLGFSSRAGAEEFSSRAEVDETSKAERIPAGSVSVDTVGIGLWGANVSGEVNLKALSLAATYRLIGLGLASQLILPAKQELLRVTSMGIALRAIVYPNAKLYGFHWGGGLEYVRIVNDNEDYLDHGVGNYLIPSAQAGYRFKFGRYIFLDPSLAVGPAFFVGRSVERSNKEDPEGISSPGAGPVSQSPHLLGDFRLDLGFFF